MSRCVRPTFQRLAFSLLALLCLGLVLIPARAAADQTLGVARELWTGLSMTDNGLPAAAACTNGPSNPIYSRVFPQLETEVNFLDGYGQRLRALIIAPVTGLYTFWIASDEGSELWLSGDEHPAGRVRIAGVSGRTGYRQWTAEAGQQSAPQPLEAGRRYYLEVLHRESGGTDHLSVRWQLPDGSMEEPVPAIGTGAMPRLVPFGLGPETLPFLLVQRDGRWALRAEQCQWHGGRDQCGGGGERSDD